MRRRATTTPLSRPAAIAALALALAGAPALVSDPARAQSSADADRASQELMRIENDLAGGQASKARLDRLARELAQEIDRLRTDMAATATRQQRTEETVVEVEATLTVLRHEAHEKRAVLASRELELGQLTGALQRLARRPPAALLLMGRPPLETVRTGILLESAIPLLNAGAERLKAELASLATVESEIEAQRARLDAATAELDRERARLTLLADEKAALLSATENRAAGTAERLQELSRSARSLRELLSGLEEQRARERKEQERLVAMVRPPATAPASAPASGATPGPAPDTARESAIPTPTTRPTKPGGGTASAPTAPAASSSTTASVLAMLPPAPPITSARGQLLRPVAGPVTRRFGQRDPEGLRNRGLVIAARPGATVVAPYDGTVIYAGAFDGFGLILIIEHGDGYHTLLAGLGRMGLQVGQRVLAGEPVGTMQASPAGGGGRGPELYVELRHNGDPIDPVPWIAGLTGKAKG